MTTDDDKPTSMADEVTKRVIEALQPAFSRIDDRFDQLTGELRATKRELGEDIDAINARVTTDKASLDSQLSAIRKDVGNLREDFSRQSTTTNSLLDGHAARFRTIDGKLDELKDQGRAIIDRLERARV